MVDRVALGWAIREILPTYYGIVISLFIFFMVIGVLDYYKK